MTFSTILEVLKICNSRLVLVEKTDKKIPETSRLEFLEKFQANYFTLSDAEDNTSSPLNRGDIADSSFIFLPKTFSNLPKVPRATFLGSNGLFCFSSLCKFGSFKNSFQA